MQIYLDSSAFLKGFRNESKSELVHDIMELCERGKLKIVISTWTLAECMSVIDKACRGGKISVTEMNNIINDMLSFSFNNERKKRLQVVRPDWSMIEKSFAYIRWYHLSADDSLHTICTDVLPADLLVLADWYFADALKNPDKPRNEQDLRERPNIHFEACNLLSDHDYSELRSRLPAL
jgi:predicted nucleic acid-binding protein